MSKLIRISDATYLKLDQIAQNTGFSKQDVIDRALHNLEQEAILKQANKAYAAIKKDPKKWQREQKELALWETTLDDGLKSKSICAPKTITKK
jgi:predicted transcriptional regulator